MDSKKLKKFKDYLNASEAEISALRKELNSYKKANYGSPIISTRFMMANKHLHDAEMQLEQGWQAYEIFKKGQTNPEDSDYEELLKIWENILKLDFP